MYQFLILSFVSSLFVCSFSSVMTAVLLVLSTLSIISIMYWNLMNMVPLYLFSLFMLGGLYVLIGFVMMGDLSDLDMITSGIKTKEFITIFAFIFFAINSNSMLKKDMEFSYTGFSPLKSNDWLTWGPISSIFIFLVIILFVYLFVLHSIMKSSTSGGGFMK